MPARIDKSRLVAKKVPARIAVVRVRTFDEPRLVRNPPPPPPIPSPPPSDFCSNTKPIMAETIMRWMTIMTVCIGGSAQGRAQERANAGHMGMRASLHDPLEQFHPSLPTDIAPVRCRSRARCGRRTHRPRLGSRRSLVRARNPEEVIRPEARAADQRAI